MEKVQIKCLILSQNEVVRQCDSIYPKVKLWDKMTHFVPKLDCWKVWTWIKVIRCEEKQISEVSHKCTKLFITERAKYFKYIHLFSIMRREIELFGLILSSRYCYYIIDRKWWMSFRIIPYPCSSILPSMFVDNTIQ